MQDLGTKLRAGAAGMKLLRGSASDVDVVLAALWMPLWLCSDDVLPFSFGQISNRTDAAIALLLECLVSTHFPAVTTRGPEAAVVLGLDPNIIRHEVEDALVPIFTRLQGGTAADAEAGLDLLRRTLMDMGSNHLKRLKAAEEAKRIRRLQALARRMDRTDLVPAMSIHQAKGREWAKVGVYLTESESARLEAGLRQQESTDRALYVAMTRAKQDVRVV